ncbi:MAG: FG-GAP repeat domain-containing protein [Planctomycetota bacterium]|jgi:hypothetical protein
MRYGWAWILLCVLGAPALPVPEPGDIFREYARAGPWVNASRWQRVTGPEAAPERARAHLPNPVNRIRIDDLDMDRDGGLDVIVGEHSPPKPQDCRLLIFENTDGAGTAWSSHLIHKGDEHHQGAQAVDIDGDVDLDIISVGWMHNKVLLYENKCVGD